MSLTAIIVIATIGTIIAALLIAAAKSDAAMDPYTRTPTQQHAIAAKQAKDANGVHIGWWIFWLLAFIPALILVAVIHFNRKGNHRNRLTACANRDA